MPYIHFTEDQKLRANSVDLVEFLRRQGEKLISSGQDKRLTSDHSITVHGNEWYDHAAERGGHAISFVQNFYGLTYPEAVTRLLNGEQGEVYIPAEKKEKEPPKEFALPPSNQAMRRVDRFRSGRIPGHDAAGGVREVFEPFEEGTVRLPGEKPH